MATYTRTHTTGASLTGRRPSFASQLITIALLAGFLVGGAYFGYLFYFGIKNAVAHADLPALPYVELTLPVLNPVAKDYPNPRAASNPDASTGLTGEALPNWEESERVNILLLGIDKRPDESIARTDTMILVTIDPASGKAAMISIPRDLWVTIPGYGENRVNMSHYLGEKDGYPGGGPALAMKTVQYNLGVPIHFYVRVDFDGFRRIVDTLGGVDIDVQHAIDDPKYPDMNYGYDPFHIEVGMQHLDGYTALKFARTRATLGADFDRARRQQQVLLAIRQRALAIDVVPKIPELWTTMAGTVQTDLQLMDLLELAKLADLIQGDHIQSVVIDHTMTVDYTTETGARVLLPVRERIRPLIEQMFSSPKAVVAPTPTPDPATVARARQEAAKEAQRQAEVAAALQQEGARVVVQNGTAHAELEGGVADYLRRQGFNVVQFGPADRTDYVHTVIVDYTGKPYAIQVLTELFNVANEDIRRSSNLKSDVDLRVIVGADFQLPEARKMSQEHQANTVRVDSFIQSVGRP
jgi:LCP family protein required for cell wall assembly